MIQLIKRVLTKGTSAFVSITIGISDQENVYFALYLISLQAVF